MYRGTIYNFRGVRKMVTDDSICNVPILDAFAFGARGLHLAQLFMRTDTVTLPAPTILRGFSWPPLFNGSFGESAFLKHHGNLMVPVHLQSRSTVSSTQTADYVQEIRHFVQMLRNGTSLRGAYTFSAVVDRVHAEALAASFDVLASAGGSRGWASSPSIYMSVGGAGPGLSFHEHEQAAALLLHGRKRWFLTYDRSDRGLPYESLLGVHGYGPMGLGSMRGWYEGWYRDNVAQWREHAWECVQEVGDVMVVPSGLLHGVVNLADDSDANVLTLGVTALGSFMVLPH